MLLYTLHAAETMHNVLIKRGIRISLGSTHCIVPPNSLFFLPTFKESCDPLNSAVPSGWKRTLRTALDSGEGSANN